MNIMTLNAVRQSQFELFPNTGGSEIPQPKARLFSSSLNLSMENVMVVGVAVIMSMVLSFSFGVEKGKRTTRLQTAVMPDVSQPEQAVTAPMADSGKKTAPVAGDVSPAPSDTPETGTGVLAALPPGGTEKNVDKVYTIQVASFKREEQAQRLATTLQQKGYDAAMVVPKGSYSIVCVGKFSNHTEAKDFSRKLKKDYKDLLVRSL